MSVAAPNKSYVNFNGYHIIPVPHHQMIPKSHLLLVAPTRFTPWTEEQALVVELALTHLSQQPSNQSSSLVTSISARSSVDFIKNYLVKAPPGWRRGSSPDSGLQDQRTRLLHSSRGGCQHVQCPWSSGFRSTIATVIIVSMRIAHSTPWDVIISAFITMITTLGASEPPGQAGWRNLLPRAACSPSPSCTKSGCWGWSGKSFYTHDGDDDDDGDYHDSVDGVDDRWCCLRFAPSSSLDY